jgi:octopine/nopaline transport system permease protein
MEGYVQQFGAGIVLTLEVSLGSFCMGLVFGIAGAAAKRSTWSGLRIAGWLYTTLVRALPELLLLLICFYMLATEFAAAAHLVGLVPADFRFDPLLVAVFSLGLIQGAYLTEIFRAAVDEIPSGQFEAAAALGLPFWTCWFHVLGPRTLRNALPSLGNVWLNATKDSSLISIVGAFADVLKVGGMAAAATKHYLLFYGIVGLIFLVISLCSVMLLKAIHIRTEKGHRVL